MNPKLIFELFYEFNLWKYSKEFDLILPYYRIGRATDNEICIDWWLSNRLSKVQCTLYQTTNTLKGIGGYAIRDGSLNKPSTNGTYLNGQSIKERLKLVSGDIIVLAPGLRMLYLTTDKLSDQLDLDITMTGETVEDNTK